MDPDDYVISPVKLYLFHSDCLKNRSVLSKKDMKNLSQNEEKKEQTNRVISNPPGDETGEKKGSSEIKGRETGDSRKVSSGSIDKRGERDHCYEQENELDKEIFEDFLMSSILTRLQRIREIQKTLSFWPSELTSEVVHLLGKTIAWGGLDRGARLLAVELDSRYLVAEIEENERFIVRFYDLETGWWTNLAVLMRWSLHLRVPEHLRSEREMRIEEFCQRLRTSVRILDSWGPPEKISSTMPNVWLTIPLRSKCWIELRKEAIGRGYPIFAERQRLGLGERLNLGDLILRVEWANASEWENWKDQTTISYEPEFFPCNEQVRHQIFTLSAHP